MPNRLALCGSALLAALTLVGCGGEEPAKTEPRPTATASPTVPTVPPGLDATSPKRPTKQAETTESSMEYGRYFAQLVQFGIETRDSRVVDAEADDPVGCTNCRTVAKLVSELERTGYWQRSADPLELGPSRATARQGGFRVSGTFTYPEVENVRADGEVVTTVPAEPYRYRVDLRWDAKDSTWRVLDFIYAKQA